MKLQDLSIYEVQKTKPNIPSWLHPQSKFVKNQNFLQIGDPLISNI